MQNDLAYSVLTDPEGQQMDGRAVLVVFRMSACGCRFCSGLTAVLGLQASTAYGKIRRARVCPSMYHRLRTA